jgi:phage N-6-adenine-methyltransferase
MGTPGSDEWRTPPDLFARVSAVHRFTLDVAASDENTLCTKWMTKEIDGLAQPWGPHTVWCNPPYRNVGAWVEKAARESRRSALVVMLVPVSTSSRWWHEYADRAEIEFLRGRLRFSGSPDPAPFSSALLTFWRARCYARGHD